MFADDIETLFRKAMTNELTEDDHRTLQDVIDILHMPEHVSSKSRGYLSETRAVGKRNYYTF